MNGIALSCPVPFRLRNVLESVAALRLNAEFTPQSNAVLPLYVPCLPFAF
jgi:hypothetical protein